MGVEGIFPRAHFNALRCTFSKVSESFLMCGHQTGLENSTRVSDILGSYKVSKTTQDF